MKFLLLSTMAIANAALLRNGRSTVDCRVTINSVMEEMGKPPKEHSHNTVCIPIENGEETDGVFPINLPPNIIEEHDLHIRTGQLYVQVLGATHVEDESLTVSPHAEFKVYPHHQLPTHLQSIHEQGKRRLQMTGHKKVAIVRIKSADGKVTDWTAQQLEKGLFGNGINNNGISFSSQYAKCSNNKLKFSLAEPTIEFTLSRKLSTYTVDSMQVEVQKAIKAKRGFAKIAELADFTMFVMPEGTQGGFTAVAPVNHWRSSYHNLWGLSLAGTMHEVGHNMGLGHAWENGKAYDDYSGYMAGGSTATNDPLTCFNGYNMEKLGWFNDKTERVFLRNLETSKVFKVSAFVDYDRAESYEPVLIDIDNQSLVLQYNRKARHNIGTREKANMLTITQSESRGNEASNMIKGLNEGDVYKSTIGGRQLNVEVCSRVQGSSSRPDALIVSIGSGASACNKEWKPPTGASPFQLSMQVTETASRATAI